MAFQPGLLDPLLERVAAIDPQMIFLTGDVTTTNLEEEFLDVAEFLKPLSDRFEVRLVPGNHDRYTRGAARCGRVEQLMDHLLPKSFPHHEKLGGRWHLLALDAAHPNRPTHVNAGAPCLPTARYPNGQEFWQIDLPARASQAVRYVHHIPCLDCNGRTEWTGRPATSPDPKKRPKPKTGFRLRY